MLNLEKVPQMTSKEKMNVLEKWHKYCIEVGCRKCREKSTLLDYYCGLTYDEYGEGAGELVEKELNKFYPDVQPKSSELFTLNPVEQSKTIKAVEFYKIPMDEQLQSRKGNMTYILTKARMLEMLEDGMEFDSVYRRVPVSLDNDTHLQILLCRIGLSDCTCYIDNRGRIMGVIPVDPKETIDGIPGFEISYFVYRNEILVKTLNSVAEIYYTQEDAQNHLDKLASEFHLDAIAVPANPKCEHQEERK